MLEALGCRIADITPERAAHLLSEQGYCFLFAQTYHPAMRHVAPVRRELAIPTVFNLLGPLVNPARPGRMVVGVAHESLGDLMIEALRLTGVHRAFVVCGEEGLDEISPAGKTHVWSLENGNITRFTVHPSDFGLPTHSLDKVRGGDAAHNAQIFREILSGQRQDAMLDYVLLNTAALLVVAGRANHWKEGVEQAREAIQSGKAKQMLEKFIHTTKQTDHA
jgi:anthranilate phosphoribosyltransferase